LRHGAPGCGVNDSSFAGYACSGKGFGAEINSLKIRGKFTSVVVSR
jgi:hypothetical protein